MDRRPIRVSMAVTSFLTRSREHQFLKHRICPTRGNSVGQLKPAFINPVRNATDAALEGGGHVCTRLVREASTFIIKIIDNGPGLPDNQNKRSTGLQS